MTKKRTSQDCDASNLPPWLKFFCERLGHLVARRFFEINQGEAGHSAEPPTGDKASPARGTERDVAP